jgi:hypothetical protein
LDEAPPEMSPFNSLRRSTKGRPSPDGQEFEPLNWLITVGTLLTLLLLLLITLQFAGVEPLFGFGLLLLGLGIAGGLLVRRSYAGTKGATAFVPKEKKVAEVKNGLQTTAKNLDLAFAGDRSSQLLALEELKDLLIDRLMLRKRLSRFEIADMAADPIWLEAEVGQAEFRWLLRVNLRELYAPSMSSSKRMGPIADFPNYYRRILELLEEM